MTAEGSGPGVPGPGRARLPTRVGRAWFASDMHLDGSRPEGVRRAVAWLDAAEAAGVDTVVLLGDVFLAWLGAPSLDDPGLAPFLERLSRLTAGGVSVVLLHGNHDFLLGHEAVAALGVSVVPRHLDLALGGLRARLCHGDALCTRDTGYQRLHAVLRSGVMRWVFGRLSPRVLGAIADRLLRGASRSTGHKAPATMGLVDAAIEAQLARVDLLLCGHVHTARDEAWDTGRLVVLADFETTGSHARYEQGGLTLHRHDPAYADPDRPLVVAMDGPAGSGKSTLATRLAERVGFPRLDSGALYRTVTLCALRAGLDDEEAIGALAATLDVRVDGQGRVLLDGRPVPDADLRSAEVSARVSQVSAIPAVRRALLPAQRLAMFQGPGLVAEGRDMATVVFPDARLSIWLDARPEVRAARRLAQNPGEGGTLEEVAAAIAERDRRDSGRDHAPLQRAPGARVLDTSDLTVDEIVDELVGLVEAARAP